MIHDLKPYPTMKDSGVPWLGQVPEHWDVKRGKSLFRKLDRPVDAAAETVTCFRDGVVTLRKNRRLHGFTEALKEIGYQGVRRGDLVIHAMDAFAGAVGVSDSDGKATPVYSVCSPIENAVPMYYAFTVREMARNEWILALSRGIRERSTDFRFDTFGAQLLPTPPADEQAAIVRFLDHADRRIRKAIAAKQRLIRLLQEQKQVIIHQAVTRGLDPNVKLKPSGVAEPSQVPAHWQVIALKRVLRHLIDCEHKTAPAVESSGYRVVRTAAVRNGEIRLSGTYFTSEEGYIEWTRRGIPEAGDVIFTREAPAGEACIVPPDIHVCLGQRTVLMKLNQERYDAEFLIHMIYGGPPAARIQIASQGSTVGHFNMDDIANLIVLAPPIDEQETIVAWIKSETQQLNQAAARAHQEIALLREYRTRLIADVVTGKLDVREAASLLPEPEQEAVPEEQDGEEAEGLEGEDTEAEAGEG